MFQTFALISLHKHFAEGSVTSRHFQNGFEFFFKNEFAYKH